MLDQAAAVEGRQGASSRREELTRRLDADKAALAERRRENEAANAVVRELGKAFQEADEAYKDARSRRRAARETVMRLQRKREINRRRVATLEEKLADPAARRRKIEDALQKAANIQRRSAVRVAELIRAAADCAASAAAAALKKAELDQQAAAIRDVSRAHEDKREEAERERAKLWKAAQMSRHRADKVMEQTRNDFPKPPAGSALARDYAAIDPSLTADQLRQQARGKKDRASTIGFGNDAVAQRYQTALQEIEKTARVASAAGKEADELTAEMDSIEVRFFLFFVLRRLFFFPRRLAVLTPPAAFSPSTPKTKTKNSPPGCPDSAPSSTASTPTSAPTLPASAARERSCSSRASAASPAPAPAPPAAANNAPPPPAATRTPTPTPTLPTAPTPRPTAPATTPSGAPRCASSSAPPSP
jgi:hypothetical protein